MQKRTTKKHKHVVAELSFQEKESIIDYKEKLRSLENEIQTKPIDKDKAFNIVEKPAYACQKSDVINDFSKIF